MYIVANRVPVAAPWREQLEERFRTRASQIEKQPGFVRLQVLRPADADSPMWSSPRGETRRPSRPGSAVRIFAWPISIPCPRMPTRVKVASNSMKW